ncbi:MAG TPA: 3-methyl-2-oxobutanoate hydroxymethyltransferase [Actinomycetota bacterium]|nr:3-methyl-2-oxobutanoate hydroxymethyltransferase [Actinomycetota bacterium]
MTITSRDLRAFKAEGRRFAMLTAYDFPTAQILDAAGVPILLVGDSVGRNHLGYANELPVTMDDILHHTKAVVRAAANAMVVADMPFMSYQASVEEGVRNAGRLVKEAGAHAVKLEGPQYDLVHRLTEIGIPAMAHVGLTPQAVLGLGGYRVQGRGEAGEQLREHARQLEKAGAFAVVLEAMPTDVADAITQELTIPTIGIGAGTGTDGQVLVVNDLLGLNEQIPKLAKKYADLRSVILDAARAYVDEVAAGSFPDTEHSYR